MGISKNYCNIIYFIPAVPVYRQGEDLTPCYVPPSTNLPEDFINYPQYIAVDRVPSWVCKRYVFDQKVCKTACTAMFPGCLKRQTCSKYLGMSKHKTFPPQKLDPLPQSNRRCHSVFLYCRVVIWLCKERCTNESYR